MGYNIMSVERKKSCFASTNNNNRTREKRKVVSVCIDVFAFLCMLSFVHPSFHIRSNVNDEYQEKQKITDSYFCMLSKAHKLCVSAHRDSS